MNLPAPLWRYWQAIWPVDYQASVQVNMSGDMRFRRDGDVDIFEGTKWTDVVLQTRGNGLFMYEPGDGGCVETCVPSMAWVLEHICLEVRPTSATMTLPPAAGVYGSLNGAILYLLERQGDERAFLAIYFPLMDECRAACDYLRRCSLTYLRCLQVADTDGLINACENVHTIEALRYSHEYMRQQKDMMRLDNTLLMSQYSANKQAFSESTEIQMHESSVLKEQLERCLDRIDVLEANAKSSERTITGLKEENAHLIEVAAALRSNMTTAKPMVSDQNAAKDKNGRQEYGSDDAEVVRLRNELALLRKENARITNRYNSYKREVNQEYERLEEFIYHGAIYEMLMYWILCNDLKVEYYETCHTMTPEAHQAFCERIQHAQDEFRTCITIARASYINCRTHIFNELLGSIDGAKLELPPAKRLLKMALERLNCFFEPDSSHVNMSEPVWMNQENIDGIVGRMLYNNMDYAWYNKLSYVSALNPVLTNDAASESMMLTLKRQLYESLSQNESLKTQVAALQKMTGSTSHWKQIWKRTLE